MRSIIRHADLARGEESAPNLSVVGKVSSASVFKHTQKHWDEWVKILEKANARTMNHQELVAYLKAKYKLRPWWQQVVATGFQIVTGKRLVGQDLRGKYMVTSTKSLHIGVSEAWKFLLSPAGLALWLKAYGTIRVAPQAQFETEDGFFGEIRTVTKNRRVRLHWQDPEWERRTVLEVMLVSRPRKKCILVFNHTELPSSKSRDRLKKRWRDIADAIGQVLT